MSAPTTPAEMADWLDWQARDLDHTDYDDAATARAIAAWIRQQPTDAQKIEALKLAADSAEDGCRVVRAWSLHGESWRYLAIESASRARLALRLLGLPTE